MKSKLLKTIFAVLISFIMLSTTAFADYYSSYTTLYEGLNNTEVTNLQNDLKSLGYFNYSSTGYFGSMTKQAVINYQRNNYLVADGIVGHATASEIKVDRVTSMSKWYLGVPYVWGGTTPSGFDCSGFTHYVFLQSGIVIQRTASLQYNAGTWVSKSNLKPGDLVFFATYTSGPSHVGIYLGNGQFIHVSSTANKVVISSLSNSYYVQHYLGAKRVIY